MSTLRTVEDTKRRIALGHPLVIAADEAVLAQLPAGHWIGGTIPYFMTEAGGVVDRRRAFVTELPPFVRIASIGSYVSQTLPYLARGYATNGCSFLILPANTDVHLAFAQDGASYPGIFHSPLAGWVAGVHLQDLGRVAPKVVDGHTGEMFTDRAVIMHCALPADKSAQLDVVNLFTEGEGDVLRFPESGIEVRECVVGGKTMLFADYLARSQIDTRLPLVANYGGATINVSFQSIDPATHAVRLHAPVFAGYDYRPAAPVEDYASRLTREMTARNASPAFSCSCILNFLYAGLEGKRTGAATGPMSFGEIAYVLLNQTVVYLTFAG